MTNWSDEIDKARIVMMRRLPFWGYLACRLALKESEQRPSCWTDGKTLFFNPKFLESLSIYQRMFAVMHEVGHCALRHLSGRGELLENKEKARAAKDYEVNLFLKDTVDKEWDRYEIDGILIDERFRNMTFEEIYDLLPDAITCGGLCSFDGEKSPGSGDGDSPSEPDPKDEAKDKPDKKEPEGKGEPEKDSEEEEDSDEKDGRGGSGNSDDDGDSEEDDGDSSSGDDISDQVEWDAAVLQAAAYEERVRGTLPARLKEIVERIRKPKILWTQQLAYYVRQSARDDFSWRRLNRRYLSQGISIPGIYSEKADVVVGIDTSGSIYVDQLRKFLGETYAIVKACQGGDTTVIQCDAEIQDVFVMRRPSDVDKIEIKGRGGTSFVPVFEYVRKMRRKPTVIVYFTDMCGEFPNGSCVPTIWVSTTGEKAPFGRTIQYA